MIEIKVVRNVILNRTKLEITVIIEFFKSGKFGDSWGENDASWKVDHGDISSLKYNF